MSLSSAKRMINICIFQKAFRSYPCLPRDSIITCELGRQAVEEIQFEYETFLMSEPAAAAEPPMGTVNKP